jgi:hypothetical protein
MPEDAEAVVQVDAVTSSKRLRSREELPMRIRRGEIIGRRVGKQPANETEHFIRCDCGGWVDCRDLGQVLEHVGPLPHPPEDQPK